MTETQHEREERPHTGRHPLAWPAVAGSLVALVTVSLAQPLLDLIGRNAAFLVAHDARPFDVVGLGIGLPLVLPLVAAAVVLLLKRISVPVAATVHTVLLGMCGGLLALLVLRVSGLAESLPVAVAVGAAGIVAVMVPLLYWRSAALRRGLQFVAITGPVVAAMFVLATPARGLVLPSAAGGVAAGLDPEGPPVVVAVFDELPVASLLTSSGDIDEKAFPGFARLARNSVFFRNATTVHGQTSDAVPAALDGRYPRPDALPVVADHPDNLFSLLAGTYGMHVLEPLTELCMPPQCREQSQRADGHYRTLLRDLAVVGSHMVLPPDLTVKLPPIDQGWRDFAAEATATTKELAVRDRFRKLRETHAATPFEQWVDGIAPAPKPVLHFGHVLLPHSPWRYLADGREYDTVYYPAGLDRGRWGSDPWIIAQAYQRHLVQAQLADKLLTRLLDRLERTGLYDEALLVVLVDHGGSLKPGTSHRVLQDDTFGEIAAVPLFVKRPGDTKPVVSDRPVETVDIMPTILDVLGADPPAGIDGRSAFDDDVPARRTKRFFGGYGKGTYPADGEEKWSVVDRKEALFGRSDVFPFPFGLAPAGFEHLLGRSVGDAATAAGSHSIELGVPPPSPPTTADLVPAQVAGVIRGPTLGRRAMAVAVRGEIAAVTLVDPERDPTVGEYGFRVLLPPTHLPAGPDELEIFLVEGDGLQRVPFEGFPSSR